MSGQDISFPQFYSTSFSSNIQQRRDIISQIKNDSNGIEYELRTKDGELHRDLVKARCEEIQKAAQTIFALKDADGKISLNNLKIPQQDIDAKLINLKEIVEQKRGLEKRKLAICFFSFCVGIGFPLAILLISTSITAFIVAGSILFVAVAVPPIYLLSLRRIENKYKSCLKEIALQHVERLKYSILKVLNFDGAKKEYIVLRVIFKFVKNEFNKYETAEDEISDLCSHELLQNRNQSDVDAIKLELRNLGTVIAPQAID